jgi:lipopolysaccharide biosynthesis glycosyltransferase
VSENKRIVVSYWSGNLTQVTFLHFLSFRRLNPEIDYVLYLDSDIGFEGSVESSLLTRLQELEISIKSVSLNSIMRESQIPSFSEWKGSYVYSLAGKISRRLIPILSPLLLGASKYKIVYSDLMGWVVGHNFPFSGYVKDRAYRSDLFRSLIFQYWPDCDILYLDLDIVITRPIDFESHQQGAIAQWGTGKSGNSAY